MTDSLLDDVRALLERGFGDDRILKQILRACENNEVISNYERNYVKKLVKAHLHRTGPDDGMPPHIEQPAPGTTPKTATAASSSPPPSSDGTAPPSIGTGTHTSSNVHILQQLPSSSPPPKKTKIILVAVGIGLVVLIAAVVMLAGSGGGPILLDVTNTPNGTALSINTDSSSYAYKDIILISGTTNTTGTVTISIENQQDAMVWSEEAAVKDGSRYSALAIAGGPGWENEGTFTVTADNGARAQYSTFVFVPKEGV